MTCKDCIRYEVCAEIFSKGVLKNRYDNKCDKFKDKSRFIELPCKVGDKFYCVEPECTENGYFDKPRFPSEYDCECCEASKCDRKFVIKESTFWTLNFLLNNIESIGKTVFLAHEEAEKVLKERESNE